MDRAFPPSAQRHASGVSVSPTAFSRAYVVRPYRCRNSRYILVHPVARTVATVRVVHAPCLRISLTSSTIVGRSSTSSTRSGPRRGHIVICCLVTCAAPIIRPRDGRRVVDGVCSARPDTRSSWAPQGCHSCAVHAVWSRRYGTSYCAQPLFRSATIGREARDDGWDHALDTRCETIISLPECPISGRRSALSERDMIPINGSGTETHVCLTREQRRNWALSSVQVSAAVFSSHARHEACWPWPSPPASRS